MKHSLSCRSFNRASLNRRGFLNLGVAGGLGLSLPQLLKADSAGKRQKSLIVVYLSGGISHIDTVDMKPSAPKEIRGEFNPIQTKIPGFSVCELMPLFASRVDRFLTLRSLVGFADEHSSFQNLTGFQMGVAQRDAKPHMGSVISKILGPLTPTFPAFVDLFPTMQHRPYNSPGPGFLGRSAQAVRLQGSDVNTLKIETGQKGALADKRTLLESMDVFRGTMETAGVDLNYRRAFDVLCNRNILDALDVDREPDRIREKYGRGSEKHQGDGAPLWNDQLLVARRLIEAGARIVTVGYGFWDTHGNNFGHLKGNLPVFDKGITALVDDLHERGMAEDTLVLVWGEFGRTPKINKDAGRDHWSRVNTAWLAGGGLKTGQIIGRTDAQGGEVRDNPIHFQDVLATVYQAMGIDPHSLVMDVGQRPTPILPGTAQPIRRAFA
jgi:hypothetical protein